MRTSFSADAHPPKLVLAISEAPLHTLRGLISFLNDNRRSISAGCTARYAEPRSLLFRKRHITKRNERGGKKKEKLKPRHFARHRALRVTQRARPPRPLARRGETARASPSQIATSGHRVWYSCYLGVIFSAIACYRRRYYYYYLFLVTSMKSIMFIHVFRIHIEWPSTSLRLAYHSYFLHFTVRYWNRKLPPPPTPNQIDTWLSETFSSLIYFLLAYFSTAALSCVVTWDLLV